MSFFTPGSSSSQDLSYVKSSLVMQGRHFTIHVTDEENEAKSEEMTWLKQEIT